ncbi:hypothetical protein Tco_0411785 [Tanacetum coccineum]
METGCYHNIDLDSKTFKVKMNKVLNENERLLEQVLSKDIVNIIVNSSVNNPSVNKHECEKFLQLETELQTYFIEKLSPRERKDTVIKKLKERINALSGKTNEDKIKQELEEIETINIELDHRVTKLIAGMLHITYIKHTQEEATVLRDLVKHVQSKYPLDQSLESACRYAKLVQELLTNISKTCPSVNNTDEKLVAVTPKNKDKRVRFTEPVTSSGNTITKTTSTSNLVSNKPMLSSTGVKPSTSASGSQPSGNTKKDKIQQTPSSTQMNKVEAYPRKVKSSFKNKDCVVQPKGTAHVQHSKCNANSELKCVKCNGCMLSDNHDLCVLDFINYVNGSNLVILGDPKFLDCSISSLDEMHVFHNGSLVFWGLGPDSKHMTGDHSQLTNFINKFLGTVKFGNDHVAKILGYGDYQIGNVTISRVYYVEGIGQNLFSVGYRCVLSLCSLGQRPPKETSLAMASTSVSSELWRNKPLS